MANYVTYKINGINKHRLDEFDTKDEAVNSAGQLHHPDWDQNQSISVYEFDGSNTGYVVYNTNE